MPALSSELANLPALYAGFWDFCALIAFAELKIADFLARMTHPVPLDALTAYCWRQHHHDSWEGVNSPSPDASEVYVLACAPDVARMMRPMVRCGLVRLDKRGYYSLTSAGRTVISTEAGVWWDQVMLTAHPWSWNAARNLTSAVLGRGPTELLSANGVRVTDGAVESMFDRLDHDPGLAELFYRVAARHTAAFAGELSARLLVNEGTKSVAAIGGGHGHLLASLLLDDPELQGSLVERPGPASFAADVIDTHGLRLRCTVIPGDIFSADDLPTGQDVYIAERVLQYCDDTHAERLLQGLAQVMHVDSQVWLVETVLGEPHETEATDYLDLGLLAMLSGLLRTEAQHRALAWKSGLQVATTAALPAGLTLLILIPLTGTCSAAQTEEPPS
ncbi:methyltransferase [Nonomuraea sp. NPDC049784]|uniref:methyltransferase n=1 Tax=Nonomuraea sp. NPDC049784 TaxID=3154361 RepID=UPI0033C73AAE